MDKRAFERQAQAPGAAAEAARLAARLRTAADPADLQALAARVLHAAAAAPETLPATYDAAAQGWLGKAPAAPRIATPAQPAEPIPAGFWHAFWALLAEPPGSLGAGGITTRTAALSGQLAPGMGPRIGAACLAYPGCAEAVAQGYPERFALADLARCPAGSLGAAFHALIVENGFDLEVLDRDALGLAQLPAPHAYLNARILQCHDLWHLAAGYRTTGLHEVAISGFQAGQFGHGYSAMFLAVVVTRTAFERPEAAPLLLDTILSAWTHGRESPPLLGLDWPALWDRPVAAVRAEVGLSPYASPHPADLFEQLTAAA
jgi:ubiquinone biosynthesis protein Coq4